MWGREECPAVCRKQARLHCTGSPASLGVRLQPLLCWWWWFPVLTQKDHILCVVDIWTSVLSWCRIHWSLPGAPSPLIDALVLQSSASLLLRSSHGLVGLRPPQPGLLGGLRSQKTPAVGSFLPAQHPTLGDLVDVCKRRPAHTAEHPSIQFDPVHT